MRAAIAGTILRPALSGLALAFLLLASCAATQAQTEQRIIVLVNDDPISAYDIEQRVRFLTITKQEIPGGDVKKAAIEMLIDERLQIQQAKKLGVSISEDDVESVVSNMAQRNNMSSAALAKALADAGVNIKTLKDRIRSQIAWQSVVKQKFRHDVNIGESDVDRAMSESDGEAAQTNAFQLRQVSFAVSSGAGDKTLAEKLAAAEALRARFNTCANVPELAKQFPGATVKSLEDQKIENLAQPARLLVTHAQVGQMTPPTLTAAGVELYAVCGKRSVKGDPKQREVTQRKLMLEEYEIRAQRLLRDIRQDAFIEYR